MNEKERHELQRITNETPKRLTENIMVEKVDTEREEVAKHVMKKMTLAGQEKMKRLIQTGSFRDTETVVDTKKTRELDRYNEERVAKAIRDGKLNPKKDRWMQERINRMRRG